MIRVQIIVVVVINSNFVRIKIAKQIVVKNFILNIFDRKFRKFIQQKKTCFQMIIELKNKYIKKDDFCVVEIHVVFRLITLKIFIDIHDFVVKLRIYNDELIAIHNDYVFRKWKMNFHFVNNFIDVYDSFIIDFFIVDDDFIEIDKKMN